MSRNNSTLMFAEFHTHGRQSILGHVSKLPLVFWPWVLTSTAAFAVYLMTMARDITYSNFGGDGGELITAAMTLGIPHPPGYPTYVLIGRLFGLFPIGTIAWRFNLFSAVAGAVAAGFVAATAYNVTKARKNRLLVAISSGLAFAFTPLVWSQSIITEVYALNMAVSAALIWALLTPKKPVVIGILLGLAITTHLSSLLFIPLAIFIVPKSEYPGLISGVFIGLLPLFVLPILATLGSPVIWGEPSTLAGWWKLITAQLYKANLQLPSPFFNPSELAGWSAGILKQYAWIGWGMVIVGVLYSQMSKKVLIALFSTAGFFALFSILYKTDDALLFFLPALIVLNPIFSSGLAKLGKFAIVFPAFLLLLNFQQLNLSGEELVRSDVLELMQNAPEEAILLTPGDQTIFTLWYFKHVEKMRPDLIFIDKNLMAFDWYRRRLSLRYPILLGLENDNLNLFITLNSTKTILCEASLVSGPILDCSFPSRPDNFLD